MRSARFRGLSRRRATRATPPELRVRRLERGSTHGSAFVRGGLDGGQGYARFGLRYPAMARRTRSLACDAIQQEINPAHSVDSPATNVNLCDLSSCPTAEDDGERSHRLDCSLSNSAWAGTTSPCSASAIRLSISARLASSSSNGSSVLGTITAPESVHEWRLARGANVLTAENVRDWHGRNRQLRRPA